MSITTAILLLGVGIVLLGAGGEILVRGATALARLARISPAIIGLTVVAMGTSLPEGAVSVLAAARGSPEVAIGNVIGSNIINVTAILGVAGLIMMIPVPGNAVRLEWPFMFLSSAVALMFARDGQLDRLEGGFLFVSLLLFMTYVVMLARRAVTPLESDTLQEAVQSLSRTTVARGLLLNLGLVVGGVAVLVAGGKLMVDGAVVLAARAGITERVIGLTVVAIGTSLPELATSIVAAIRRETGIALSNVIGSNIFNVLGILGVSALVHPLPVSAEAVSHDFWWMIGVSLLILPIIWTGRRISRVEAATLLLVYLVYIVLLIRG